MVLTLIFCVSVIPHISHVKAEAPKPNVEEVIIATHKKEYTREDIINLTELYAEKYEVSPNVMKQVVYHESHFNNAASGDDFNSWGVCQIYLPAHPGITKEMAQDPHFCLTFLAKNLKSGQGRMWTGYRLCELNEHIVHKGVTLRCDRLPEELLTK